MKCGEICVCLWCSFYITYGCCFCGHLLRETYDERVQRYKQIKQEYDDIPHQIHPIIEIRIERSITTPLSTIEEEPIGYQDFR